MKRLQRWSAIEALHTKENLERRQPASRPRTQDSSKATLYWQNLDIGSQATLNFQRAD